MIQINICICTYKREKLLISCLESLAKVQIPSDAEITVTVIDNDHERSAEKSVNIFRKKAPFQVYYHCENKRGIPCARNRAIDETQRLKSDYLVFIDDDEWAQPDWLVQLYTYCKSRGGDVIVSGSVISELPQETPEYILGLFNKKRQITGTRLTSCATNNVLVPIGVTNLPGQRFDETNFLAGGTDTIFFYMAVQSGAVILKCAEALVHEVIPPNRVTLKWLAKRKFRAGITVAWRKRQEGRSRLRVVLSSIFTIILELLSCSLMILIGNRLKMNKSWLKVCRSFGILSGILGLTVASYRVIDGQ